MTDTPAQSPPARDESQQLVPRSWPPADPIEPVTPRRIHWLLALPATIPAMLFPRRLGPHLANSSWVAAYLVHFSMALIAFGVIYVCAFEQGNFFTDDAQVDIFANPLIELRRALAAVVLLFFGALDGWPEVAAALLITAMIEAAIWVAALLLIPLYAAGEGRRRTYLRSVKLLLWSSACQVPIVWLFTRLGLKLQLFNHDAWPFALLAALELWWLAVLIRLGGRYGGPKEGPRWQDRQPRCEACGYSLISLPLEGRCPECGALVADSLPERRQPPAFAAARGLPGRCVGFAHTTWQALFLRHFAKQVTIWGHHRAARNYVLLICVLFGLISAVTYLGIYRVNEGAFWVIPWPDENASVSDIVSFILWECEFLAKAFLVGIGIGLSVLAWLLLLGLFLSRFGFRDVADRVVILCYSTAWLFVPLFLGIVGICAAYGIIELWGPFGEFHIPEVGWIDYEAAIWLGCLLPSIVTDTIASFRRTRTMLRHTRFANA